jgi:hypothetical protein
LAPMSSKISGITSPPGSLGLMLVIFTNLKLIKN